MSFIFLTILLLILFYLPNFTEGFFILDDQILVGAPQFLSSVPYNIKIKNFFTPSLHVDFYPLRDLSYLIDWFFSKNLDTNLFPAKIQNLFWFLICGIFIFKILEITDIPRQWSGFLTSLWLLHPYNAELLLWASSRKDLLSLAFFLIGSYSLLRLEKNNKDSLKINLGLSSLAVISFIFSDLSKAGLLLLPISVVLYLILFKVRTNNHFTWISLLMVSSLNFYFIFLQKWLYSKVNDMSFDYEYFYRIQASITAFGKMFIGLFYFPAIIIDAENCGEWADLNRPYLFIGIAILLITLFSIWIFRKNKFAWFFIFLTLGVYAVIPGPNIYHRHFFSNRYFSPIFLLMIIGGGLFISKNQKLRSFKSWHLFYLLLPFIFLVFIESFNWESNKSIVNKAVATTQDQPNVIFDRLLTYIELHRWGRLTESEIQIMENDYEKLLSLCTLAAEKDLPNGSLCFSFWRDVEKVSRSLNQKSNTLSTDKLLKIKNAYSIFLSRLKKLPYIPYSMSEKITESQAFHLYEYYRNLQIDNSDIQSRIYRIIDECFRNPLNVRNLYERQINTGLLNPIDIKMAIADMVDLSEKKLMKECFSK